MKNLYYLIISSITFNLFGETFVQNFFSANLPIEEKINVLKRGELKIDKMTFEEILQHMESCDKTLLLPLAKYLVSSDFCTKDKTAISKVKKILLSRILEFKTSAELIFECFTFLEQVPEELILKDYGFSEDIKTKQTIEIINNNILLLSKILNGLDTDIKAAFVVMLMKSGSLSDYIMLDWFGDHKIIKELNLSAHLADILNSDNKDLSKDALIYLLDYAPIISDKKLISVIIALSDCDNVATKIASREILKNIFPFAIEKKSPDTFDWISWWDSNKNKYPFKNMYYEYIMRKDIPPSIRIKCFYDYIDSLTEDERYDIPLLHKLIAIIMDNTENETIRLDILKFVIRYASFMPDKDKDKKKKIEYFETVVKLILQILSKNTFSDKDKACKYMLSEMGPKLIDNPSIRDFLYSMVRSEKYPDSLKLRVCNVLSRSETNKKKNAFFVSNFLFSKNTLSAEEKEQIKFMLYQLIDSDLLKAHVNATEREINSPEFWAKIISKMPDDPPEELENKKEK